MQEIIQTERYDAGDVDEGKRAFQEWSDHLLSTPEARARYEEIAREQDLWLQLVQARLAAGMTQAELAHKMGISQAQVAHIEKCGYEGYTLKTLRRHVRALGKTLRITIV